MSEALPELPSPCIGVCRLDSTSGLCQGCLRTAEEIGAWGQGDRAQQHAILALIKERRTAMLEQATRLCSPRRRIRST